MAKYAQNTKTFLAIISNTMLYDYGTRSCLGFWVITAFMWFHKHQKQINYYLVVKSAAQFTEF